jgi:hypothetical protein
VEQAMRGGSLRIVGNITLIRGPRSDNSVGSFINQTFEIRDESLTAQLDKDGRLSVTRHPKNVTWHGGKTSILKGVTRVQIVSHGQMLLDKALTADCGKPKAFPGGISFDVAADIGEREENTE